MEKVDVKGVKGKIDFGIITIREDEFEAVLQRFPPKYKAEGNRIYNISLLQLPNDEYYQIAIVRCTEQGTGEAQSVTEDLIMDIDPQWLLVVGIAGGVPEFEFTLGDIVGAMRLHDFSVEAVLEGKPSEYAVGGGPMHKAVQIRLADLRAMKDQLGNWNEEESIGMSRPPVELKPEKFYGDEDWKKKVEEVLTFHFGPSSRQRAPLVTAASIASSNKLVKDSETLQAWHQVARDVKAVEMELAGVYKAARKFKEYPVLAIRGISDIVGFKRHPNWTAYACHSAAAFAYAFLKTKPIPPKGSQISEVIVPPNESQRPISPSSKLFGLPVLPNIFLGREDDLSILKERLGIGQAGKETINMQVLTAVRGWPGIGKTAMATVLGNDSDIAAAFSDGVLWASLGQIPNLLSSLATWGRALGTEDLLRVPTLKEATQMLAALLRKKNMLLVVDDVWETEHVIPFQQARGESCALLITTRVPKVVEGLSLPDNAIYNLPPLTEERALELLGILAPQVVKECPNECLTLVRDIECLPLALHVAGRLLNSESKKGWGVIDLLKELGEGAALIKAKAPADLMDFEKQTIPTVAALLQKSTERLDDYTRDCFAFLAPFAPKPATFDLEAMEAAWLVDDPKPIARVLIDYGLLEPVGGRFQMHALLLAHARSLLTE